MTEHLDLDALADALAADDPPAHVAGCADCRAELAELRAASEQVRGVLAGLPPVEVPADIADRLDAALAAERSSSGASVTTLPARTGSQGGARWLPAAAAAVLVLGGAAFGVTQLTGGGGEEQSAAVADGAGGTGGNALDVVRNDSGNNYVDRASLAAAVPSLLAGTAARSADDSALTAAAPAPAAGGTAQMSASAPAEALGSVPQAQADAADPLARLRSTDGLADCLAALLPPDDDSVQPLALDYGQFKGTPALVVLLPGAAPRKLDVFVVGATCSRANDSVLFYTSVDAP